MEVPSENTQEAVDAANVVVEENGKKDSENKEVNQNENAGNTSDGTDASATEAVKSDEELAKEKEEQAARAAELKEQGNDKYREKDYYGAVRLYESAIELDPENSAYYNNRAAAEIMLQQHSKAIASLRKCLELDPENTKAMIRLGKAYIKCGKAEEALEVIRTALEKDPTNSAAIQERQEADLLRQRLEAAREAIRQGQFQRALQLAQAATRQAPESRELGLIRVKGLVAAGDFDQAYSLTTKLMRESQNDSELLMCRAQCLYFQENFPNAIRHLQQALQLDPDHKESQQMIKKIRKLERLKEAGNAHFKAGRNQEAIEAYSQCLEVDPDNKAFNSKLHANRAASLQKQGKFEEAVKDCDKAIELNPDYGKAYMRRAACLRGIGGKANIQQALNCYDQAERIMGRSNEIQKNIRDTKIELKKAARKDYYKILELPNKENSTEAEIKKAYKKAALKWHPDRHAGKTEEEQKAAEDNFKDVGEAYEVLSDSDKKYKYDQGMSLEEIEQGGPMGGGHDPNEIFQMFFGGGMGGGMGGMGGMGGGGFRGHPGGGFGGYY